MSGDFDSAIEPLRSNLLGLIDCGRHVRESHGFLPVADSEAMREYAGEREYAGRWGERPVYSAHSRGGFLVVAAEDHLRSVTRLLPGEPVLYGPQVLLRAATEAAGRSMWFTESGIGTRRRVARWQTDRLHDAMQVRRLGPADDATRIEKEIFDTAEELGFKLIRGRRHAHTHVEETRPSSEATFRAVLNDLDARGLGHMLHSFLSAVTHGTNYGMIMQVLSKADSTSDGRTNALLGMTADQANQILGVGSLVLISATDSYLELHGWTDKSWVSARGNTFRLMERYFPRGSYSAYNPS